MPARRRRSLRALPSGAARVYRVPHGERGAGFFPQADHDAGPGWGSRRSVPGLPQLFASPVFPTYRPDDQRQALRLMVLAKNTPSRASTRSRLFWELLRDARSALVLRNVVLRRRASRLRGRHAARGRARPFLLVIARPTDAGASDARSSAASMLDALDALGGLVHVDLRDPPTFAELDPLTSRSRTDGRARRGRARRVTCRSSRRAEMRAGMPSPTRRTAIGTGWRCRRAGARTRSVRSMRGASFRSHRPPGMIASGTTMDRNTITIQATPFKFGSSWS